MAYDDEKIAALRAKSDEVSQSNVIPRGMRQYAVIFTGLYPATTGGAAYFSYVGVIWFRKDLTAYQRYVEATIVIDRSRANDLSPSIDPKEMPEGTLPTFFQCVPDRSLTGHYWAATRRDARAIWSWMTKPFHKKPNQEPADKEEES